MRIARQGPPHRPGYRVATLRAIENDAGERRFEAQGYIGHEALEARRTGRLSAFLSILLAATGDHERPGDGVDGDQARAERRPGRPFQAGFGAAEAGPPSRESGTALNGVSTRAI